MKLITVLLLILGVAIGAFAALNWGTFNASTNLSFWFTTVQVPLGLLMLGLAAFLIAVSLAFAVFAAGIRNSEARRRERELQASRELAEHAENSRFTKLQGYLEAQTQRLADTDKESRNEILARLERLQSELSSAIDQSGNTLAAYIGEFEDRVEKESLRVASNH